MELFSKLTDQYKLRIDQAIQILPLIRDEHQAKQAAENIKKGWGMELIKEMLISNIPFKDIKHYYIFRRKWNGSPAAYIESMQRLGRMKIQGEELDGAITESQ